MSSLFAFGTHCALDSCRQLDYLPFKCDGCQLEHCLNHRQAADHQCMALQDDKDIQSIDRAVSSMTLQSSFQHFRCSHMSCKKRELTSNECKNCSLNFCLSHRFPHQHSCKVKQQILQRPDLKLASITAGSQSLSTTCATQARSEDRKKPNTNIASQSRLLRSH